MFIFFLAICMHEYLCKKYPLLCRIVERNGVRCLNVTACILTLITLSACVSSNIYRDPSFNPPVYFGSHVVRSGDTLYAISRRYGRDFKELARVNRIEPPYALELGQKIDLELSPKSMASGKKSGTRPVLGKSNVTVRKESGGRRGNVTKNKKHKNFKDIKWSWPHVGPILAKYRVGNSANAASVINKGINIGGRLGDPILAAASGEVVYAGNGLLGYGNLVIINHNERFLSAYAHNREILVQEGQQVIKGKKIAEMGRTGTDKAMLHFEIRIEGSPVDPLKFLPAR